MLLSPHANSTLYHVKSTWMNEGKGGERGKNHLVLAAQLLNNLLQPIFLLNNCFNSLVKTKIVM